MDRVVLDKLKLVVQSYIAKDCLEFAVSPDVIIDDLGDALMVGLRQAIWGEKLEVIRYPANWLEAVKERFAPEWVKRRRPVLYREIEVRALYPRISLPKESPIVHVWDKGIVEPEG